MPRSLPPHELERLTRMVTGRSRSELALVGPDGPQRARLEALVTRRLAGEPLQYLEGEVPFGPIEAAVDARALIPRPETELLWEIAVAEVGEPSPGMVMVDLGTGSGVLALALKHAFPGGVVYGTDASGEALSLARENAIRTHLEVTWLDGDLFAALPAGLRGKVGLLVSNPPYVAEAEWAGLPAEIREHEPRRALVAGPEGTEMLARIAAGAGEWLAPNGLLVCEIGETQEEAARLLFAALGPEVRRDLAGRPRFVIGRRPAA